MGFVIYIVRQDLSPLTGGELRKYFRARKNMEMEQDGTSLKATYKNPLTGASFYFTYSSGGRLMEVNKSSAREPGEAFQNVQLSCSIDYLRPSFFAYEASVEIDRLVNELSLSVLNPQSPKNPDKRVMFVASDMLKDWQRGNSRAVAAHIRDNGPVPTVNPKYSGMIWKYMIVKGRLRDKFGKDVIVPEMEILRAGKGSMAHAVMKWKDCEPTALPDCQSVIIRRVRRKGILGIGRKVEEGLARYEDVVETMKPFTKSISLERPAFTLPVLMPERRKKARKAFRKLPLNPLPELLESVPVTEFVDVLPARE